MTSPYNIADFGPSDLLSSEKEGERRVKVEVDPKLTAAIDIFGQMNTAEYTPIVSQKPLPGLSFLRDEKVGGDAEFSVIGGEIRIDGGLGLRSLYTKDYGLYLPGLLGLAGLRARMATPTSGTYRFGYGNGSGNRVYLENVNGSWTTNVQSDGTKWYSKARSEWLDPLDGTGPSGINASLNGTALRIILGWYGGISILFTVLIADRINGDKLVVIDSTGERPDGVTLAQPDLPIFAEANGGVMYVGGRQYGVFGRYRPRPRITSNRKVIKAIPDENLTPIISMRPKSESRWLSVPILLDNETVTCTKNCEYIVIIGGTLENNGVAVPDSDWVNLDGIDANETALLQNTTATDVIGGYRAPGDTIVAGQGNRPGRSRSEITQVNIPAGTAVTIAIQLDPGETSGTASAIMRMREFF